MCIKENFIGHCPHNRMSFEMEKLNELFKENQMSKYPLIEKLGLKVFDYGMERRGSVVAADLERVLESAQVVYGVSSDRVGSFGTNRTPEDTHTARIIMVEEIKREACKHEPENVVWPHPVSYDISNSTWKCKHCGVKLKAEWKEES